MFSNILFYFFFPDLNKQKIIFFLNLNKKKIILF